MRVDTQLEKDCNKFLQSKLKSFHKHVRVNTKIFLNNVVQHHEFQLVEFAIKFILENIEGYKQFNKLDIIVTNILSNLQRKYFVL